MELTLLAEETVRLGAPRGISFGLFDAILLEFAGTRVIRLGAAIGLVRDLAVTGGGAIDVVVKPDRDHFDTVDSGDGERSKGTGR